MSTFFAGPRRSTLLLLVLGVMSSLLFALYIPTHVALAQEDAEPAPVSVTGVARQGDDLVVSLRWEARTAPSNAWLKVGDAKRSDFVIEIVANGKSLLIRDVLADSNNSSTLKLNLELFDGDTGKSLLLVDVQADGDTAKMI